MKRSDTFEAICMADTVVVIPEAAADLENAAKWYEERQPGVGEKFLARFKQVVEVLCCNPDIGERVKRSYRRVLLNPYPYALYYDVSGDEVRIWSVVHSSRDDRVWKGRLP